MSKPECRRNGAANLRHLIICHFFELRHSDFFIFTLMLVLALELPNPKNQIADKFQASNLLHTTQSSNLKSATRICARNDVPAKHAKNTKD